MAHGSYVKGVFPDAERKAGDFSHGTEFIEYVKKSHNTAYTEFGCNGAAPRDYILRYVMDEKDYADCNAENPVWKAHHAFRAWNESCWLGIPEVIHFFGGYENTDDLIEKSIYLQDLCYKTMFEEMRRQAPLCSMAVNWDFNEPWPCAAGNSLVAWPNVKKSCLTAVGEALRPTLLSLETPRNRYLPGEVMEGTVWLLNDSATEAPARTAEVYLVCGDRREKIAEVKTDAVNARENGRFGSFTLPITDAVTERFSLQLVCPEDHALDSRYDFVCNHVLKKSAETVSKNGENDDFSDFLR
jgi:beta-mannosidase